MNFIETALDDVKNFFKKAFKSAPSATATALAAVNVAAPEVELVLSFVDPEAAAIANPIITEVQADLGTLASLLKNGNTTNVPTFAAAIKANLSSILAAGHIKSADSVSKAQAIVNAVNGVMNNLITQFAPAPAKQGA